MELMDEERSFWEFVPQGKMPKAFLMTGKRHEENMDDDSSDASFADEKPSSFSRMDDSDDSLRHSALFRPSSESAFSKIGKHEHETGNHFPFLPIPSAPSMAGFYPGFFPNFYSSHFMQRPTESEKSSSPETSLNSSFEHPSISSPKTDRQREVESFDKNMFYYVDPRIPFTNYFLNLTKLLNNSAKDCKLTTPIGKMAGEDQRADDSELPITPDSSSKSSARKQRVETISSPESEHSSAETDDPTRSPEKKELKIDVIPDRLNIPNLADPRFLNPFAGNLLQATHPGNLLPVPGAGLFHPALMHLPGTAYRRYNPEKPPPVKKYKCDVCGKAFSRSNTLVTHKRIHTGDKPFKCEICSRAFRQPGNLTRHRLTHTTVKPYVCPTCNKAFNRASNLHTHMRTHSSFKGYVCPYCGKGFHQKIDMKIHCYTHTAHASRPDAAALS